MVIWSNGSTISEVAIQANTIAFYCPKNFFQKGPAGVLHWTRQQRQEDVVLNEFISMNFSLLFCSNILMGMSCYREVGWPWWPRKKIFFGDWSYRKKHNFFYQDTQGHTWINWKGIEFPIQKDPQQNSITKQFQSFGGDIGIGSYNITLFFYTRLAIGTQTPVLNWHYILPTWYNWLYWET